MLPCPVWLHGVEQGVTRDTGLCRLGDYSPRMVWLCLGKELSPWARLACCWLPC